MNVAIFTGKIAKEPEKNYSESGMAITKFTLAVKRDWAKDGQPDADFVRITAFDKRGEWADKYLSKGTAVGIEAQVQTGSYKNKDGNTIYTTDFIANKFEFLEAKKKDAPSKPDSAFAAAEAEIDSGTVPF